MLVRAVRAFSVLDVCHKCNTLVGRKILTVRLPRELVADIEAESRSRSVSKSDVVRERLGRAPRRHPRPAALDAIADLIGSVEDLPSNLSARKKEHLRSTGYGEERSR